MGNSFDDASDRQGYTRPKRTLRPNYGFGSEISTISSSLVEESPSSPTEDRLFLSVELLFTRCELQNGWACEGCVQLKKCQSLFNCLADVSALGSLDSKKAREFVEKFEKIKKHTICD